MEAREGRFRNDLLHRLRVVTLHVPPLRERSEDLGELIPILAAAQGRPVRRFAYRDPGIMAIVGRAEAVVQLRNGVTMRGLFPWLAWIFVHIAYLLGGRNRITVLNDFFWRYLGPRHSAASVAE